MIVGSLDDIITRNPKPKIIGYHDEMLNAQTVLKITFLEDVLAVTNILSLVLQSDRKDFGAVRRALSSTLNTINDMKNINSIHLKSFRGCQDVLDQFESYTKQNVPAKHTRKKLKIDHSISIEEFHENIAKPFLAKLVGN